MSDTLSVSSPTRSESKSSRSSNSSGVSPNQKTVSAWFHAGEIECDNVAHYHLRVVKMDTVDARSAGARALIFRRNETAMSWPVPSPKTALAILEAMESYKASKCKCERDACRAAWGMNAPGVYQTEFVAPGALCKGVGEYKLGNNPRRVMPVAFRMSAPQLKVLHERFPDWHFVQTGSAGHDHPVSHATTQIATFEAVKKLAGKRVLDVHGNPTANELAMRSGGNNAPKITTVVSIETPKDKLRQATKWGKEMDGNKRRYYVAAGLRDIASHPDKIAENKDVFLGVHTGYYYPMKEIATMLACSPGSTGTFIMHRFEGSAGSLNNGELAWVKDDVGHIVQTNVLTGERYTHPDNSHWFSSSSWTRATALEAHTSPADALDSLAWTTNMVCEGTYTITATAINARVAHLDPLRLTPGRSDDAVRAFGGVDVEIGDEKFFVPIPSTHAEVFDELRGKMNHKARDEKKWAAHVNTCQQKVDLWKTKGLSTDSKLLSRIQLATFWVDFASDAACSEAVADSSGWLVRAHKLNLSGASLKRGPAFRSFILRALYSVCSGATTADRVEAAASSTLAYLEGS